MVLDSSAIVAIHLREPSHERLIGKIDAAEMIVVGVPILLETIMVLNARLGQDARPMVFAFLRRLQCEIVPFNEEHLDAAVTAFVRFGRGRHPASLNFGDCISYAVASVAGMPLLFTGEDFSRTDITPA
jgi:ribonuclease VapC